MKYELNKPYNFEVKRVIEDNGTLTFQVEIEGNLFPVKAYPEQLEGSTPSIVSCRIILDKDKNAYLVQNEAYLYPFIYKPNHKYIFEVLNIKDSYVLLQDKHGLYHTMEKDESKFSLNEIIVRYVEVVMDNDYKAHLRFYLEPYNEGKEEIYDEFSCSAKSLDASSIITQEILTSNTFLVGNKLGTNASNTNDPDSTDSTSSNSVSVSSMILSKDWDGLKSFFNINLYGAKIPTIQQEILSALIQCDSSVSYWEIIQFLVSFNAHMFLATIVKADHPKISDIMNDLNLSVLDDIIHNSFLASDKTKYALDLIKPCKKLLTIEQKNFILSKCSNLNSSEAFYDLFNLFSFSPDAAVSYLLSLHNNDAAAFTLYKFYLDGKKGNRLKENSVFESFRPSIILQIVHNMEKINSYPFDIAATLISCNVLSKEICPHDLQKEVADNGLEGFKRYISRKKKKTETKNMLSSLTKGDTINDLCFIKEIDNYYLLINQSIGAYALLEKDLTEITPRKDIKSKAKIAKVMNFNGKTVFIVNQKDVSSLHTFPPLINQSTILEISFSEGNNGKWYPIVKNYCKLLKIEIETLPRYFDLKRRYRVKIIRSKNFFTYIVKIMEH